MEIDPVAYGVLTAKVENLEKKIDKMEEQLEKLVGLANQSKGGFWAGMVIVSAVSSAIGFLTHYFGSK